LTHGDWSNGHAALGEPSCAGLATVVPFGDFVCRRVVVPPLSAVMPVHVTAIHAAQAAWMAGTIPVMTMNAVMM
jgi:hypothetical protein